MTPRANPGVSNPNSFFDAKTVREIRLLHLCDGIAASQIARDLDVNVSCISRIVNWKSWAQQDEDLRAIPKPGHKGGGDYHQLKPEGYVKPAPPQRLTCRSCLHLNENTGVCDFGFPESLTSAYTFAAKCSVYQALDPDWRRSFTHENINKPTTPPPLKLKRSSGYQPLAHSSKTNPPPSNP